MLRQAYLRYLIIKFRQKISFIAFCKKKTVPEIFYEALLKSFRELVSLNLIVELQPKNEKNDKLYKDIIGKYHTCDLIKKTMKMNGEAMGKFFT